ncbi:DNA ligase (ATP) DNL4 KNAG_0F02870 [Huiozyma naganishii CBS 8797]|uniref:DNA ligase n=1 Tax=Huiozyma naganishii (strain ATCC MYA-139 / BCRC 22969 / CBS 8797 / KCTC 17520 / NBRC 10181 / NCYC 3082 / Yp74L-3) TaxID=1071383 RepID=J7S7F1_HUIN7|nr:hypothetical protein KNAG_0F02870 [Kazachstania naganishii CBS 8797]CCK70949.1 hypothetical protein KNAG_0F02870 [Kazachstania naganishii CBS 8797]
MSEKVEEGPTNFAPSPDFQWLCDELFVKFDLVATQDRRINLKPITVRYYEVVSNFVQLWRKTVGNNFYPVLILALPYRDRRTYNIKDVTLIKAICLYLDLPKRSSTEKKLLNWKQRASRNERLSSFCVAEIRKRKSGPDPSKRQAITLDKLNSILDDLANGKSSRGQGSRTLADSSHFKFCLENMSFIELKYFFDILLKVRIIGGHEHKLLNAWHPDAVDYFSVVSDLSSVTKKLYEPSVRLRNEDLTLKIGSAFAPHLAKRLNISYEKILKKLGSDFSIEEKMDGERIQIHYMDYGNEIKFLSRRGTDYTYLYGGDTSTGTIACYLKLNENVKECILDGEMVTYDQEKQMILPFGLVKSSAKNFLSKESISNGSYHPLFMAFDLVYLNGTSLVDLPLYQRKDYLSKILTKCNGFVDIVSFARCNNLESITKSLAAAISVGSEGIILKKLNSRYMVASRNDSWIKIKPQYLKQFGENMDLIIIGRDPGKKDAFMCALGVTIDDPQPRVLQQEENVNLDLDTEDSEPETPKASRIVKFVSFCTIANGISNAEFKEIDQKTRGLWRRFDQVKPPSEYLQFGTKKPVEWIDPKESLVLEVKSRSLDNTESNVKKYRAGVTLFGGYCRAVRYDKDWTTCYTVSEFERDRQYKLPKVNAGESITTSNKGRKKRNTTSILGVISPRKKRTPEGEHSDIFQNLHFCVLSDYLDPYTGNRIDRNTLTQLIIDYGGKVIYNVLAKEGEEGMLRIICDGFNMECNALIKRGYDILSPSWVLDCIESARLLKLERNHCFNVSKELMELSSTRVDEYDDSFENEISTTRLDRLIDVHLHNMPSGSFSGENLDFELRGLPPLLFFDRSVFIAETKLSDRIYAKISSETKLFGGQVTHTIEDCNLIIIPNTDDEDKIQVLQKIRGKLASMIQKLNSTERIPPIVSEEWLYQSIKENIQVPEENYSVLS